MVLRGILATTSGLANDSKHTLVKALFTQPSDLLRSWEKTSSQTGRRWGGGKGIEPAFFWGLYKRIPERECFRNKPHPQFSAKQMRLNLRAPISVSSGGARRRPGR